MELTAMIIIMKIFLAENFCSTLEDRVCSVHENKGRVVLSFWENFAPLWCKFCICCPGSETARVGRQQCWTCPYIFITGTRLNSIIKIWSLLALNWDICTLLKVVSGSTENVFEIRSARRSLVKMAAFFTHQTSGTMLDPCRTHRNFRNYGIFKLQKLQVNQIPLMFHFWVDFRTKLPDIREQIWNRV